MNSKKENPIFSITFNLILPVIILKNGDGWIGADIQLFGLDSSMLVLIIALLFPIIYFLNDFIKNSKTNFISILGFVNILLTGLIGILGEKFGISKNWFIIKESIIPLAIGILILVSMSSKTPLVKTIVFNDSVFNIARIDRHIKKEKISIFDDIFRNSTYLISGSFFLSSVIQFFLARIIITVDPGHADFNDQVGTMTWMSYFVVMIPCMSMFGYAIYKIINGITEITGLKREEILNS